MTVLLFLLSLILFSPAHITAQEIKPLYKLPDITQTADANIHENQVFLAGTDKGLYRISNGNSAIPLWTEGKILQILHVVEPASEGKDRERWYFRTNKGILTTKDLTNFELRNNGLTFQTIKKYDGANTTFVKQVQAIKDICANPMNPLEMVTATEDHVFISRDGGMNWKSVGSMSRATPGMKAVAIATMPDGQLAVFMSHPIFGISYILPDSARPTWRDVTSGFEMMPSLTSPDEIADILPMIRTNADGTPYVEIYMSQTFLPRIYKFNWEKKMGEKIYIGTEPMDSIDGLTYVDSALLYTKLETLGSIDVDTKQSPGVPAKFDEWKKSFSCVPGMLNSAWIPQNKSGFSRGIALNELWLLYPGTVNTPYAAKAMNRKCVYVSAYQCRIQAGIDKFRKIIRDNKLNSLVIDMKDDYGFLRYDSKDPLVMEKGRVTQYKIDIDHFVSEFKKDNVYLIARIVVFKDRNLSKFGNSKYAVWDYTTKAPWIGVKEYSDITDATTGEVTGHQPIFYDENWVDPYCPEVWEYNVQVAKELISRGFDEIQFDYIRFPTDGYNLNHASYRWKSEGMDKESALISFLSYARENIKAPVGIDIYGANGWYRSGTRTGQDSEMLSDYVDVIGPMFYPSHFEQKFLDYSPRADRSYRIYYYGTFRTSIMTRNTVIARPWVQAFYLNVSYDRQFYDSTYVQKEIFGVRDSVDRGYMYWNNSGDYSNISPDIGPDAVYIGTAPEADKKFRKPAIGTEKAPDFSDETLTVLDTILQQEKNRQRDYVFTPLLQLPYSR